MESARDRYDSFASEVLIELPKSDEPQECYRLYRVDILAVRDGKTVAQETNVHLRDVSDGGSLASPKIRLVNPMVWNGLQFRVVDSEVPEGELIEWTRYWLDIDDNRYRDVQQFQSVVHNVTRPSIEASKFELSVDFGSAPTEAFDQLLRLLCQHSRMVTVGSFSCADVGNRE
ncbi:MAG: hypothetical protein KDB11_34105 [Planctomycetales bacterium]|nr:hypothetical protein [Planctomycetales bacterium]